MDSYQTELRAILKVWVFSFNCATCIVSEKLSVMRMIIPPYDSNEAERSYSQPPSVVCDCDEILYNFSSKDLYDLFLSLYDTSNNIIYIPRSEIYADSNEESFDLMNT